MAEIKNKFQFLVAALRIKEWWNYKIQLLLAGAYWGISMNKIYFKLAFADLFLLVVWLFGVFSLGYFINNIYDSRQDIVAGKNNLTTVISPKSKIIITIFLMILVFGPWFFIHSNYILLTLVIIHFILAILYSMPPIRFKEKGILGIIDCALIEISLPLLIIIFSFSALSNFVDISSIVILIAVWSFFFGARNILFHQIDDYKNDTISGVKTFVVRHGLNFSVKSIDYAVLPVELLTFLLLIYFYSFQKFTYYIIPVFIIGAILITIILKISASKHLLQPKNFNTNSMKMIYNMINAVYEIIVPFSIIIHLIITDKKYLVFLLIHILLFRKSVIGFIFKIHELIRMLGWSRKIT